MAEKRLIDANALYDKVEQKYKVSSGRMHSGYREFLDMICDAPTVDAVEVVRCKDCRFCRTFFPEKQIGKEARRVWYCDLYRCNRKADEYCSDGERREEGNNGC